MGIRVGIGLERGAMPTLTDAKCRSAQPRERPYKLFDGLGLYLWVNSTGAKRWRASYRIDGALQTATFGPYPEVSLAEARRKLLELRAKRRDGEDPRPKRDRPALSLRQVCDAYWNGRANISDAYRGNVLAALEMHVYPTLGDVSVGEMDRARMLACLNVMNARGLYVYVRRVRTWLAQPLDWAVEHGHCVTNVARNIRPEVAFGKRVVQGMPALSQAEMPGFIERLKIEDQTLPSVRACWLILLTWARTGEVRQMLWPEVEGDVWRIPAGKMKRRREHVVPLVAEAVAVLEQLRAAKRSDFVLPADHRPDRPISENAVLALIARMGYRGRMSGHGVRSVASTWANERGYPADVIETQLAHAPDDATRAAYNRASYITQRREMLQAWARWLQCPTPQP